MIIDNIVDDVYYLGTNISEPGYLFEGMWPVPDGISINAYAIKSEKNVLIDTIQDIKDFPFYFREGLKKIGLSVEDIDYVVVNHMEPDHSQWLQDFHRLNPKAEILCTPKAVPMIEKFSRIKGTPKVRAVADGESLEIGPGRNLVFHHAPNVHWPETMVTFDEKNKILFSCDAFGSYGLVNEVFDDHLSDDQLKFYETEALRYYANIISGFSPAVKKALATIATLDVEVIAPSHGIVWRESAQTIFDHYARYAGYFAGPAEPEITIVWGSMYGFSKGILSSIVQGIRSEGVPVHIHRVPQEDIGFILASAWRSQGIVLGMPTYEYKMFPPMVSVLDMFNRKKVKNKKAFRFGSFGWSGGAQKELDEATAKLKWDFLESIEWQGAAGENELEMGYKRGAELARMVKECCSEA